MVANDELGECLKERRHALAIEAVVNRKDQLLANISVSAHREQMVAHTERYVRGRPFMRPIASPYHDDVAG